MTEDERTQLEVERIQARALLVHFQQRPLAGGLSARAYVICGNPIPEARRQAIVGVRLCVACKQAEELESNRYG